MYEAMFGGIKAAAEQKKSRPAAAPPSHALQDYAGRYHHPGYGDVTNSLDDGKRVPNFNDLDRAKEHSHHDTWGLQLPVPETPPLDMSYDTATDVHHITPRNPLRLTV